MSEARTPWAIVLAAGDGTRLARLTTDDEGRVVPKQFWSLRGGTSLLGGALARALAITEPERIVVVVAAQHEPLWRDELADVDSDNVLVQPRNLGTAPGILLPLMAVLERDPHATVAVLPSDHFVEKEAVLASALRAGIDALASEPHAVALLGVAPDSPESDYGWIVPRPGPERLRAVETFVEKPPREVAVELIPRGALWNSFVFAARGVTLAAMYDEHLPELLDGFEAAFEGPTCRRAAELEALYASIARADFSRELLEPSIARLRVLDVPPCGWTDLGTPARVRQCIGRLASRPRPRPIARALDLERRLAAAVS